MPTSDFSSLADAHRLLKQSDCLASPSRDSLYPRLQSALRTVVTHSDYQILGICANSLPEGLKALSTYALACGYRVDLQSLQFHNFQVDSDEAVYIKYNPTSGLLYASGYEGSHRGVLIACQSDQDAKLNEMYGHLPLDLFDSE